MMLRLALLLFVAACLGGCGSPRGGGVIPEALACFSPGTWARIDREASRVDRINHGMVVIRVGEQVVYRRSFGALPTEADHRFDVASLAKPLAGVPAAELTFGPAGENAAAEPVAEFRRQRALVSHLLQHTSGLDDEVDYPAVLAASRALLDRPGGFLAAAAPGGLAQPLLLRAQNLPASPCWHYSNSGYILLSLLVAAEDGLVEDRLAKEFWQPLGMTSTGYIRGSGEVQSFDPMADLLLGARIATPLHSGLLSTADDVARFPGTLATRRHESETMERIHAALFGSVREMKDCGDGHQVFLSPGGLLSPVTTPLARQGTAPGRVFIATGYTGCLLWFDTETGVAMAVLTDAAESDALPEWRKLSDRLAEIAASAAPRGGR